MIEKKWNFHQRHKQNEKGSPKLFLILVALWNNLPNGKSPFRIDLGAFRYFQWIRYETGNRRERLAEGKRLSSHLFYQNDGGHRYMCT